MEGTHERSRIIRHKLVYPVILLISLFSCARSASFELLLACIDQTPSAPGLPLFLKAVEKADSTDEKLRVLKRLRRADEKTVLAVAALCGKKQNTEPVVMALIDFYLDASQFDEAFRLFNANLSCSDNPELYAEIVLSALKDNVLFFTASLEDLHRAGIQASQPVLLYCAALKCMAMGNPSAAGMFTRESAALGFPVPAGMLWDTRLFENILVQESRRFDSEAYLYLISAAFAEGNKALTANIARQFLEAYPDTAWQAYIALGVLACQSANNSGEDDSPAESLDDIDWPHEDLYRGYKESDNADYWFSEAYRLFPSRFEVLEAFMKFRGQSETIALIPEEIKKMQAGDKNDRVRFFQEIHGASSLRTSALAVELAAKYPHSPEVIDLVLYTLFRERSWENFLQLLNQYKTGDPAVPINVFFDIVARVCSENLDSAIQEINRENSGGSYAYIYNLGLLETARKNYGAALDAMKAAASKAADIKGKVRALIHMSYIEKTRGNPDMSEAYKRSAISLDPDCLLIPGNYSLLYGNR